MLSCPGTFARPFEVETATGRPLCHPDRAQAPGEKALGVALSGCRCSLNSPPLIPGAWRRLSTVTEPTLMPGERPPPLGGSAASAGINPNGRSHREVGRLVGFASLSARRRRGVFSNLESHAKTVSSADVGGTAGNDLATGPEKAARRATRRPPEAHAPGRGGQPAGTTPVAKSQRSHPPGLSDSRRRRRGSESHPHAKPRDRKSVV